jgi:(E)-4-hydroxy-3-methylbut-2-enyl-diphosphate synthase
MHSKITIGGCNGITKIEMGSENGARFPPVIQTMWKDKLHPATGEQWDAVVARIHSLGELGCGLLRFAVPAIEDAQTLGALAARVSMPLCADIHFDYKIALRCLDFPIAKLRINPGNIGGEQKVRAVLEKAKDKGVPVRIGVNMGSLPLDIREKMGDVNPLNEGRALLLAAERELEIFDRYHFEDVVVSMKASSVEATLQANRLFHSAHPEIPLHIGVTEAGPLVAGVVRNSAALVPLLQEGIGATLRVSLSDSVENEVIAAREIVMAAGELRQETAAERQGVKIVSCPRCGRCSFDTHAFTRRWLDTLYKMKSNATIAIMGCAVNGPGEARDADLGITGAGNKALVFRKGQIIHTIDISEADAVFGEELVLLEERYALCL